MTDIRNVVLPLGYERYVVFLQNWGIASFAPWGLKVSFERASITLGVILLGLLLLKNPLNLVETAFHPNWKWSIVTVIGLVLGVLHTAKNSPFLYFQF